MKTCLVVIITHFILLSACQPIFTHHDDSLDKRVYTPCQEGYCLDAAYHAKRAAQATPHAHSSAFNVIHVIAAIAGMMGILIVGIISFFMLKRRKRQRLANETEEKPTDDKHHNQQFAQFAHDFSSSDSSIVPPPSMQQRHLQLELLKQQHTSMDSPILPPYHP